jgi:hypothetical protein
MEDGSCFSDSSRGAYCKNSTKQMIRDSQTEGPQIVDTKHLHSGKCVSPLKNYKDFLEICIIFESKNIWGIWRNEFSNCFPKMESRESVTASHIGTEPQQPWSGFKVMSTNYTSSISNIQFKYKTYQI